MNKDLDKLDKLLDKAVQFTAENPGYFDGCWEHAAKVDDELNRVFKQRLQSLKKACKKSNAANKRK